MNLSQTLMPNIPSFLAAYFPVKIAWDLFRLASAVFNSSVFILFDSICQPCCKDNYSFTLFLNFGMLTL